MHDKLMGNARNLRKGMTPEERHLWYDFLKKLPVTVRRQHIIGDYIVDFYIPVRRIVIEVDGRQHLTAEHKAADAERDRNLSAAGIRVLRYSNQSIHESFQAVAADLLEKLMLTWDDVKR